MKHEQSGPEYPLTESDLAEVARRMTRKENCIIPIRRDVILRDGVIAKNCLTWGSAECYEIVQVAQLRGVLYYGRWKKH